MKLTALLISSLLLGPMISAQATTEVPYEQAFEEPASTWTGDWINAEIGSRNRLSDISDGYTGSALRVSIPTGQHFGSSLELPLDDLEEAWATYYLRIPESMKPGSQGKLPGFAGEHFANCGQGGSAEGTDDCWTARMGYSCRARHNDCSAMGYGFYVYHPNQQSEYGDFEPLAQRLEYGRWYCVQIYVRMNDVGQNNGVLAGFIDGDWVYNNRTVEYRRSEDVKSIQSFWMDVYEGGKWTAQTDVAFDFDQMVISHQAPVQAGCLTDDNNPFGSLTETSSTSTTVVQMPESKTDPDLSDLSSEWPTSTWWSHLMESFIWRHPRVI